mmetsp:Transcript_44836/g.82491  ORF Transcript_44836/g.82491 Transcript_44836/m.82491 type:complete len:587 (-) Transcript_44836:138-1898(-)
MSSVACPLHACLLCWALFLASLAWEGHGRRVRSQTLDWSDLITASSDAQNLASMLDDHPAKVLAALRSTSMPLAAFHSPQIGGATRQVDQSMVQKIMGAAPATQDSPERRGMPDMQESGNTGVDLGRPAVLPRLLVSGLSEAESTLVSDTVNDVLGWSLKLEVVNGSNARVVLLTNVASGNVDLKDDEDEWFDQAEFLIEPVCEALDTAGSEGVVVISSFKSAPESDDAMLAAKIDAAHAAHVARHRLRVPVATGPSEWDVNSAERVQHATIDGDWVSHGDEKWWDLSEVAVFDGVVDEPLRKDLLKLLGPSDGGDGWDPEAGADSRVWERGSFADLPGDDRNKVGGFGLQREYMKALCDEKKLPPAILELQSRLTMLLEAANGGPGESSVSVCRMSEDVLGQGVIAPVAANAPVASDGDEAFGWHIDADPMLAPPSPWTDAYGRYPNRAPGGPRFVTAMVYLSPQWEAAWGAPTRFLDSPTGDVLEVSPAPGRLVLMDQDITHSVTAPESTAGDRPRYSLVLKLVIHPPAGGAAARVSPRLADESKWGPPQPFGSAVQEVATSHDPAAFEIKVPKRAPVGASIHQ